MTLEANLKYYSIDPSLVIVKEGRHRKTFSPRKLDELSSSIKLLGQLQPGICTLDGRGTPVLLVGERRLRACHKADLEFKYLLKEEVLDPWMLEKIELEENLCREELPWQDACEAKERIHKLFEEQYGRAKPGSTGGQSLQKTADYLGESLSLFQEDIVLATWAREVPEVAAAPNKTTAKKIVARLLETVKREDALENAIQSAEASKATDIEITETEGIDLQEAKILEYDRRCLLGKMEDRIAEFKDESVDIVLFDPPWGVDFTASKKESPKKKDYEDTVEEFTISLAPWLRILYKKMSPDSHLYMFFGIINHALVYNTLETIGFTTNRMPLIWHKRGAHVTRNPTIWPGRSYEPIAYARKGSKNLAEQGAPDVISTPSPSPGLKDIHPSAKHPEVYRSLLSRSASPGDTILDPMAGSGMSGVACESLREKLSLDWWMIEQDSDYRNLSLMNLIKGYESLVSKKEEPSQAEANCPAPGTEEFQSIQIGSAEWIRFWKLNKPKQELMLAWKRSQEGPQ